MRAGSASAVPTGKREGKSMREKDGRGASPPLLLGRERAHSLFGSLFYNLSIREGRRTGSGREGGKKRLLPFSLRRRGKKKV